MRRDLAAVAIAAGLAASATFTVHVFAEDQSAQLGPRPFYLVDKLSPGPLKSALQQCSDDKFKQTDFLDDILYWIDHEPKFGKQAVFLDDANVPGELPSLADLKALAARGVRIVGPPMWALLTVDAKGKIVPSPYARNAKAANLDIITWTLDRSGRIVQEVLPTKGTPSPEFYHQTTLDALHDDGDILTTLDVLAKQVGIRGIFSDWAVTVSYYANCMGLK